MAGFPKMLPRRRVSSFFKLIALGVAFWWLVSYGFKEDTNWSFGERLDRNLIENINEIIARVSAYKILSASNHEVFVG